MKRLFSTWLLALLAISFVISGAYSVSAQKVLEARLTEDCKNQLSNNNITNPDISKGGEASLLENKGKFSNVFDFQSNLPFVPSQCALDKGVDTDKSGTTALPVKYFPFVLLRVYKFMISLAFYLFGFGLIITGVMMQTGVFVKDYNYYSKLKKYLDSSIFGLITVLFAYYIVYTVLWIFNVDNILTEQIINTKN